MTVAGAVLDFHQFPELAVFGRSIKFVKFINNIIVGLLQSF
ncbi:hypothetical protein L289_1997 [Acinetobacter gerneri DSM 14967 = CIP 107464 = MTCC 9824]|jgi:hypothetical protein|nr:hypothetical protein L289_1997 [Acinetobacter gerneri DSM 14967 = CIP 107464 = MTCC 9824]